MVSFVQQQHSYFRVEHQLLAALLLSMPLKIHLFVNLDECK
jgi:hypothetical protein